MYKSFRFHAIVLLAGGALLGLAVSNMNFINLVNAAPDGTTPAAGKQTSTAPLAKGEAEMDAKANEHLKAMCSYLAGLKEFAFHAEATYEVVQDSGQKLQFTNLRDVLVARPNRVVSHASGDTANRSFYYDGKTVTLYDKKAKAYAVAKASPTIDAMLDEIHKKYGFNPPLADVLFSNPYKVLTERLQSGLYVGLSQVGKTKCHHLAFRQKGIDWQLWIDAGKEPLPRKIVITFKREVGEPQFYARLSNWNISPKVDAAQFTFRPPQGATKVEFVAIQD